MTIGAADRDSSHRPRRETRAASNICAHSPSKPAEMHERPPGREGPMVPLVPLLLLASMSRAPVPVEAALDAPTRHVRSGAATFVISSRPASGGPQRWRAWLINSTPATSSSTSKSCRTCPPRSTAGCDGAGDRRLAYVRVQLRGARGSPDDTIALLGHELRHAMEIAERQGGGQRGIRRLYGRIGMKHDGHRYEDARRAARRAADPAELFA